DAQCVFDAHYAYLLASWAYQPDFRHADALVDAGLSADGASLVGLLWSLRSRPGPEPVRRIRGGKHHTISKKALHKQGPMPTDRGLKLLEPPRCARNRRVPVTGPLSLENLLASGGSGTPLNCPRPSPGWSQPIV